MEKLAQRAPGVWISLMWHKYKNGFSNNLNFGLLTFQFSNFRVLFDLSWFPCVETEVLLHILYNNLLECSPSANWSPKIFNSIQCHHLGYRRTESVLFILLPVSRALFRLLCIEYVYLTIPLNLWFFDILVLCVYKCRCLNIDVLLRTHSSMRDHVCRNNFVWPENHCKK